MRDSPGHATPPNADLVLWSDDDADPERWCASAAAGSAARLSVERDATSAALRFDFTLAPPGAWAIARREIAATLPAHYIAALRLRGDAPPNDLQLKLVDETGANVWWWRRPNLTWPRTTERLVLHRASLDFAWGPATGGDPRRLGAVEVAVASGQGGSGTLWIDDLRIEPREPIAGPPRPRLVRASSSLPGHEAERLRDGVGAGGWRPVAGDARPWIELDFGQVREWGGLLAQFESPAPACRVLASNDGAEWTRLVDDPGGARGRRWLRTGATESRFVRLELAAATNVEITGLEIMTIERAVAPARWVAAVAAAAPRGRFPRHLLAEQGYWAAVGGDGDLHKGLLGEDGALEVGAEAFTLEPFLWANGSLTTWADTAHGAALLDGCLPIPSVDWSSPGPCLRTTAFATGEPGRSALVAQYVVSNPTAAGCAVRLLVAIRPFQVTPAWQSLNLAGAVAPITALDRAGARVLVNDARSVVAVTRPDGFGAACGDDGLDAIFAGRLPADVRIDDPLGFAEGVLAFDRHLPPGGSATVVVAVPLFDETPAPPEGLDDDAAAAWCAARLEETAGRWRTRLARTPIALPPSAAPVEQSLRASLGWILVSREGPRLQPGVRTYRRSWIRDGAFIAAALAEMQFADEARDFLRWYAPHQHDDGRVPAAVDRHGVDETVEHDSHGQLAWSVVEVFRLTRDRAFLRELWPHVRRAADAIIALRAERTGDAWRASACFGLLPESISHEGYASRPVHSYWDDFFALCGLEGAAEAADVLGEHDAAVAFAAARDAMRRDVGMSIARTRERHGIDFVPGSVELGDLDPTSTAVALDPGGELDRLRAPLERTFDRYWAEFEARRRGTNPTDGYTPYEARDVTALLLLGWPARATAVLEWLVADQRPTAWRQWPEVAHRDRRAPRFLGDLPHGWVAASFVRALRRLIAYERAADGVLVVGAGVPEAWVREAPGVRVDGMPTWYGPLRLRMVADGGHDLHVVLSGVQPPGGIVLASPMERVVRAVDGDSRARIADDRRGVWLPQSPAEVFLRY